MVLSCGNGLAHLEVSLTEGMDWLSMLQSHLQHQSSIFVLTSNSHSTEPTWSPHLILFLTLFFESQHGAQQALHKYLLYERKTKPLQLTYKIIISIIVTIIAFHQFVEKWKLSNVPKATQRSALLNPKPMCWRILNFFLRSLKLFTESPPAEPGAWPRHQAR